MNVMRFTVIDRRGGVSFVAPCNSLPTLVAACAKDPETLEQLLDGSRSMDSVLRDYVLSGLAVFDEHNLGGRYEAIHSALRYQLPYELPVFRVVDAATREASLTPVKAGAVLFNLAAKRIVQIQNTYAEIQRSGRFRWFDRSRSCYRMLPYKLPPQWSLVP